MTQKERIKELLSDGNWHDQWDFVSGLRIIAYDQRINEMNRDHEIETETRHEGSHWWWRLVPNHAPKITAEPDGQLKFIG